LLRIENTFRGHEVRNLSVLLVVLAIPFSGADLLRAQTPSAPTRKSPSAHGRRTVHSSDESQIRDLYSRWARAFQARDLDGIMAVYAPENDSVVSYDIVAPLQFVGRDAYRKDYQEFLAQYEGPVAIEYRDMRIFVGNNVAFLHTLERMNGTLKGGQKSDIWVRATSGLRKSAAAGTSSTITFPFLRISRPGRQYWT
jgi:uncharacterized protein (TIGR02246 family)